MIVLEEIEALKKHKALLAFSHGSDSTALFYLLKEQNITFDCALINYQTRQNSDIEANAARILCAKYNKKIFTLTTKLSASDFENKARKVRYDFFAKICAEHGYSALITAHQLNDYFEWFLMSLERGAGLCNLLGFDENLGNVRIFRPLKYTPKDEILEFLKDNNVKYFDDISNDDLRFKRNFIRKRFSNDFVKYASAGLRASFKALNDDKNALLPKALFKREELFVFENSTLCINAIDKACKALKIVISAKNRELIKTALKEKKEIVLSHKIALCATQNFVFLAPFCCAILPKEFKEKCRKYKIPSKIRPYLFTYNDDFKELCEFLKVEF